MHFSLFACQISKLILMPRLSASNSLSCNNKSDFRSDFETDKKVREVTFSLISLEMSTYNSGRLSLLHLLV